MWQMIAEPGLRCSECRHVIQPGRLCLSELPEETPRGVFRGDFANYCVGCPECWRRGRRACYVRRLESGNDVGKLPRALPCARCARRMPAGDKAGMQTYYDWPEAAQETRTRTSSGGGRSATASTLGTAVGADTLIRGVPSASFEELGNGLQRKFAGAGLGGERGYRALTEAQAFYQDSAPYPVRNLGGDAVQRYLEGKDASHIQSWENAPSLARNSGNILWERSDLNRARGSENMTGWEELGARSTNAFDASAVVFRECLETAAMTALYGALLEAPVAALENIIHHRKGRKSGEEAIRDAATAIAKRAAQSAAVGFSITAAVALTGAGAILVTIAPILMPVGFALYGYAAVKRVLNALRDGLPLNRMGIYFCSPRCHAAFAYESGRSALMRWDANRVDAPERRLARIR